MVKKQNKTEYRFLEELDGKEVHLHQLKVDGEWKNLTGTSSISSVVAKVLTWWASGKACEVMGWIKPLDSRKSSALEIVQNKKDRAERAEVMLNTYKEMSIDEYLKLLDKAYKAHSVNLKETAQAGTDLHAELERYVKAKMKGKDISFDKRIIPFVEWSNENVKEFIWAEAHSFDEDMFLGGISDAGAILNDGKMAIIDFKSHKEAYFTDFMQCGGYSILIEKNGLWSADGKHHKELDRQFEAFVVFPFGAAEVEPVVSYDVEAMKDGFRFAVGLYRLINNSKITEN